jgi:hypothetical protein
MSELATITGLTQTGMHAVPVAGEVARGERRDAVIRCESRASLPSPDCAFMINAAPLFITAVINNGAASSFSWALAQGFSSGYRIGQ